ncbi:AraC family transcriptional regulator [Kribbella sp. NPDC056861]|uniref:helix-turn-helix domain-containing protein n=1 Tax=Kribbella sp. NPDC056861 TaxID=3154857 RepID=UPI0034161A10
MSGRLLTYGVRLVFELGDAPTGSTKARSAALIGPRTRALEVRRDGDCHTVSATLPPWIAFRAFGDSLQLLADRVVQPAELLGPLALAVERDLLRTPSSEGRLSILATAIRHWCADGPRWSPEMERAWRLLQTSGGMIRVGELADAVGLSSRALAGRFAQQVGLSPKKSARLIRVGRACQALGRGWSVAEIVEDAGYFDPAHFMRDFKGLLGLTPGAYVTASSRHECRCAAAPHSTVALPEDCLVLR